MNLLCKLFLSGTILFFSVVSFATSTVPTCDAPNHNLYAWFYYDPFWTPEELIPCYEEITDKDILDCLALRYKNWQEAIFEANETYREEWCACDGSENCLDDLHDQFHDIFYDIYNAYLLSLDECITCY